jgi:hypothetical protein
MATESIGDASVTGTMADLLELPDMTGHHVTSMAEARMRYGTSATETVPRNNSLRELY